MIYVRNFVAFSSQILSLVRNISCVFSVCMGRYQFLNFHLRRSEVLGEVKLKTVYHENYDEVFAVMLTLPGPPRNPQRKSWIPTFSESFSQIDKVGPFRFRGGAGSVTTTVRDRHYRFRIQKKLISISKIDFDFDFHFSISISNFDFDFDFHVLDFPISISRFSISRFLFRIQNCRQSSFKMLQIVLS